MDGAKAVGGHSPEQARSTTERLVDLEENARKFAAGQAAGCDERRLTPLHAPTVRESLQQQLQYHCNEIRRILDLKDHTPHVILEMPASKLRTLHVTIS